MATIRIATFNVENLLQRFNFYSYGRLTKERALELMGVEAQDQDYMLLRKAQNVMLTDDARQQTAQAIRDTGADIVCLQEVENRDIVDDFNEFYLKRTMRVHYGWRRVIDGNDIRGIDVGVMSKGRISVISHADITFDEFGLFTDELADYGLNGGDSIFRRDCLEVNLKVEEKPLTLFVCHFKSMSGGRDETRCVREAEAKAVRKIIENKFGGDVSDSDWSILGDFNDYLSGNHSLGALFENDFSVNLVERLSNKDQWTHYYSTEDSKHQLDYILVSPGLAAKNPKAKPDIIRAGQPYRVPDIDVQRYPRIGLDRPKASDHCPVAVTLKI
ncbi:MAG: endonuclease/exonuclease/phosphatase family protein [Candidatus Zixiibacteriota bacterium]|nr:MAG: endonuclease/exonuclease/phosphatase family protein [candidate division Zixibacteria bacterium]